MTHRRRGRETAGFTLVELMIAVMLSSVVVALVFQIHLRMVDAFGGQTAVTEVLDRVTAARSLIVREARMAGIGLPAVGIIAPDGTRWHAIEVDDDVDGTGADQLLIRRRDGASFTVSNSAGLLAIPDAATLGFVAGEPMLVTDAAAEAGCAAVPSAVDDTHVMINWVANPGCATVSAASTLVVGRLLEISFRLDPDDLADGILERLATTGGGWEPYGLGFANLQLAQRMSEPGDVVDADGDGNPALDWYSGANQEVGSTARPASGVPIQLGISIEARSTNPTGDTVSLATMPLTDVARPANNPLGNWGAACPGNPALDPCGVDLQRVTGTARPARYDGDHVYRATSTRVWLRNQMESL